MNLSVLDCVWLPMDFNAPLTPEDLKQLDTLMEEQRGMCLSRLHGYLTACLSGPSSLGVNSKLWMPCIWSNINAQVDPPKFEKSIELIMRLCTAIVAHFEEKKSFAPLLSWKAEPYEQACGDIKALQQWCQGYLEGVQLAQETGFKGDDTIAPLYRPILTLASDEQKAKAYFDSVTEGSPEELRSFDVKDLPKIITEIHYYWHIQQEKPPAFRVKAFTLVGRNDPCPCGSGRKYKKCCWQKMMHS